MPNEWFFFALLSTAIFAVVNLLDDNLLRKVYRTPFFGAIISGYFGLLPLLGIFFYPISIPPISTIVFATASGFLTVIYYLYYFKALEKEYPSIVIALFGLTPALVPFMASAILNEALSMNQYVGFTIVLVASIGLSIVDIKKIKISQATFYILFAATIYAFISILQKVVYQQVEFYSGYVFFAIGLSLGSLFLSVVLKEGRAFYPAFKKRFPKWFIPFLLVELVGIAAELTNNYAISKGPVSLVKVIEATQPMYVLLFAILLYPFSPKHFREAAQKGRTKKFLLMILICIGLFIIYYTY